MDSMLLPSFGLYTKATMVVIRMLHFEILDISTLHHCLHKCKLTCLEYSIALWILVDL